MKNQYSILLVLLITTRYVTAQYLVQPTFPPFTGNLYSVSFTDANHGWAVGDSGTIYRYNGFTWTLDSSGTNLKIRSVCFTDSLNGWAVGEQGLILNYSNHHWHNVHSPVTFDLDDVNFSDPSHGWAHGFSGLIQYTNDSWQQVTIPGNSGLSSSFLLDSVHGWLGGIVSIFYQYNNQAWSPVNYWWISSWDNIRTIYFQSLQKGWINVSFWSGPNSGNRIEHWDGNTWHLESFNPPVNGYYAIDFYNNRGWFVGALGEIACHDITAWVKQPSGVSNHLYDVSFINSFEGWIVGSNGIILHTTTGGFTGIPSEQQDDLIEVYPNPATEIITMLFNSRKNEEALVQIRDGTSRLIQTFSRNIQSGRNDIVLDISNLNNGTYFINVILSEGTLHQKFIKI
jgi:hypothetical protein